jgi:hypothetical protein
MTRLRVANLFDIPVQVQKKEQQDTDLQKDLW